MSRRLIVSLQAASTGQNVSLAVSALLALLLIAAMDAHRAPSVEPPSSEVEPVLDDAGQADAATREAPAIDPATPLAPATVTLPSPPPRSPPTIAADAPPTSQAIAEPGAPVAAEPATPEPPTEAPTTTKASPTEAQADAQREPGDLSPATKPALPSTVAAQRRGRALLMLLESGGGPSITIDWPVSANDRTILIDRLLRCHGMELALLVDGGSIVRQQDPPDRAASLDLDRWSGFLRVPSGGLTDIEQDMRARLQERHGPGRIVRLFPRWVDSGILGSLFHFLGEDYRRGQDIRLAYEWAQGRIALGRLRLDGVPHDGRLMLPEVGPCDAS